MSRLLLPALLAAAAYAVARIFFGYRPPARALDVLAPREAAFLDAAAGALFPAGGAVPPSGSEAGVAAYADRWVGAVPRHIRILVRMLFFLVEHATVFFPAPGGLFGGGMKRFSALSSEQRVAVLDGWHRSRLFPRRIVFTSLRAIVTMGYFSDPGVLRALRLAPYDFPSPVSEADLLYPRIGASPDTIRWTRADLWTSDGTPLDLDGPVHPAYAAPPGAEGAGGRR